MSAYDPRSVKGIGITYATSTKGSDHSAGYCISVKTLKVGGFLDPLKKYGQAELSRRLHMRTAPVDSSGLCVFIGFPIMDDEGPTLGGKILVTEHEFNLAAGFMDKDDSLPEFFEQEPILPHNVGLRFHRERDRCVLEIRRR